MFANNDNEKTIKTYAALLQNIREGEEDKADTGTHYTFTGKNREHVTNFMSNTVGFDPKTDKGNGL